MNTVQQAEFASKFRIIEDPRLMYDSELDMRIRQETMLEPEYNGCFDSYLYSTEDGQLYMEVNKVLGKVGIVLWKGRERHRFTRDIDDIDQIISDLQLFTDALLGV